MMWKCTWNTAWCASAPWFCSTLYAVAPAARKVRHPLRPILLLHDEQVVEPPQKEVPLLRRLPPVPPLQLLVVPHHRDDVDRLEVPAHDREQLETDRHEGAPAAPRVSPLA